jgi:hypothetical protein
MNHDIKNKDHIQEHDKFYGSSAINICFYKVNYGEELEGLTLLLNSVSKFLLGCVTFPISV